MFNWLNEARYALRYLGSGALNTLLGFLVIFLLTSTGVRPIWANVSGYLVGFVLGFIFTRKLVFRSKDAFINESLRYLIAFFIAFGVNLIVLHFALNAGNTNLVSQLLAAATYTSCMYILSRFFVFKRPQRAG
jgi:putative flippase GtrA